MISYEYDSSPNGIGQVSSIERSDLENDIVYSYRYNSNGLLESETQLIDDKSYITSYMYDDGKLSQMVYPSGLTLNYSYSNGHLETIYNESDRYYVTTATDRFGHIIECEKGGLFSSYAYNDNGYLTNIKTATTPESLVGDIQDLAYSYSSSTGNLCSRNDNVNSLPEYFLDYDRLNRLKVSRVGTQSTTFIDYDDSGILFQTVKLAIIFMKKQIIPTRLKKLRILL